MREPKGLLHALAAAAVLLFLPPARAQTLPESDTREVRAYSLTDAAFGKYVDATRRLATVQFGCDAAEPAIGSLSEAAARIEAVPGAKDAVRSAGLTSREYIVFAFALVENAIAAYALEQPGGKLPPGISMANVEFLRRNSGVLERLATETEGAVACEEDGGSGG
jgi:hypothetical protein